MTNSPTTTYTNESHNFYTNLYSNFDSTEDPKTNDTEDPNINDTNSHDKTGAPPTTTTGLSGHHNNLRHNIKSPCTSDANYDNFGANFDLIEDPTTNTINYTLTDHTPLLINITGHHTPTTIHTLTNHTPLPINHTHPPTKGFYQTSRTDHTPIPINHTHPPTKGFYQISNSPDIISGPQDNNNDFHESGF